MAIKVEREDPGMGGVLERCCFCRTPTPFWAMRDGETVTGGDVACCESCAANHEPYLLPSKRDWCDKEEELNYLQGKLPFSTQPEKIDRIRYRLMKKGVNLTPNWPIS